MSEINIMCNHDEKYIKLIPRKETYPVKGVPITIDAMVPYCTNCNEEVFYPKYDDVNLKKAYAIYNNTIAKPGEEIKWI